jgi:hypothetical protein
MSDEEVQRTLGEEGGGDRQQGGAVVPIRRKRRGMVVILLAAALGVGAFAIMGRRPTEHPLPTATPHADSTEAPDAGNDAV